jgi:hypothetical protein
MMTMLILSGVAERTPTNPHKPWIHVRVELVARIRMGLAIFSAEKPQRAFVERKHCSLNNALGA